MQMFLSLFDDVWKGRVLYLRLLKKILNPSPQSLVLMATKSGEATCFLLDRSKKSIIPIEKRNFLY